MKTLVIAEKPDMGRRIAAVIEPKAANKKTYLEGDRYIVTWAIGHLVALAEPEHYDPKYKKWNFDDLPIVPDAFKLLPNPRTADQLNVIRALAERCGDIVNACDAGREGQLIFAYIRQYLGLTHPVKRLWISDLTPETIRKGFAELKDESAYDALTRAARARSEADWLIGINGSRAFSSKHRELLSVGRVQTPVLAMICERQKQIESFVSKTYYEVEANFVQKETAYRGVWQGDRLTDPARAEAIAAKVKGKTGAIASYEAKTAKEYPLKLYDLTLLQRDANAKFGFSAKKTLDIAQALYEKHQAITYPRTNSNYVNEQNIPDMHRALDALRGTVYDALANGADKRLVHKNNKAVCNPAKVEDHHAILPTAKKAGALSPEERKLYDLIVRRFLSHFYPAAEYKTYVIVTEIEGEPFKSTVKQLLFAGWKAVYADDPALSEAPGNKTKKTSGGKGGDEDGNDRDAEETVVTAPFELNPDEPVRCAKAAAKQKETKPPKPFTEGTLLQAMESAGKQLEDEQLREAMKDCGLGTPATRAAIIERLKQVGYIAMRGRRIEITPKGRAAIELVREAGIEPLTSPEMTGQWERTLNEIARGRASDAAFMEDVKRFARAIVDQVRAQPRSAKAAFAADRPAVRRRKAGGRSGSAPAKAPVSNGSAASPRERAYIAPCPREGCGGRIFPGRKGYGCTNYKNGCAFVIWKESFGKTITPAMVKHLIEKGRTRKLKWTDRSGSAREGRIVLKDRNIGRIELEPV